MLKLKFKRIVLLIWLPIYGIPLIAHSQTFKGNALVWDVVENADPRVSIKTGSTGINIGGYEGTTLVIKNLTNRKLVLAIRQTITDLCGVDLVRNPTFVLMPNETIGGSTFLGGLEQYDFDSKCKERKKYADNFYTKISNISLKLTEVKEVDIDGIKNNTTTQTQPDQIETSYYDVVNNPKKNVVIGSKEKTTSNTDFWGNKIVSPENNSLSQGQLNAIYISEKCTPQRLGIMGSAGADCIPLTFISEKVIQYNSTNNAIQTDNSPDNFILSFKRSDENDWIERDIIGNQIKYFLTGLAPCTSYEIKIQRNCGSGVRSVPTIPLEVTTRCQGISSVHLNSVTPNSIQLKCFLQPDMSICSSVKANKKIVVEYRMQDEFNWRSSEFDSKTPPKLNNLNSQTTYVIRARIHYMNNTFSTYSKQITLKTK